MTTKISIKRILILLGISGVVLSPLVYTQVDAYTLCGPLGTLTVINPREIGEERAETARHEAVHVQQVERMGCFNVVISRLTTEGRNKLEAEAQLAE